MAWTDYSKEDIDKYNETRALLGDNPIVPCSLCEGTGATGGITDCLSCSGTGIVVKWIE